MLFKDSLIASPEKNDKQSSKTSRIKGPNEAQNIMHNAFVAKKEIGRRWMRNTGVVVILIIVVIIVTKSKVMNEVGATLALYPQKKYRFFEGCIRIGMELILIHSCFRGECIKVEKIRIESILKIKENEESILFWLYLG